MVFLQSLLTVLFSLTLYLGLSGILIHAVWTAFSQSSFVPPAPRQNSNYRQSEFVKEVLSYLASEPIVIQLPPVPELAL